MTRSPRFPDRGWVRLAVAIAFLIAALTGYLFYWRQVRGRSVASLSDAAREELAALPVMPRATSKLEATWVSEGFSSGYLMAPVGPMPCGGEVETILHEPDADARIEQLAAIHDARPQDLLIALALATQFIDAGRYPEAERVATEGLERSTDDERVIAAARAAASTLDLGDASVSTVIHLHHALGVARLSQSATQPPWKSLKNVIGSVKTLSQRRLRGAIRGQPAWSRLLIPAPGCASTATVDGRAALSSYDLFDNLIVAYMRGQYPGYPGIERDREREFGRAPKTYASALHTLLLAQVERARSNDWKDEAQLWALSNVEQVIDWRMPDDARLALNSVQVIDWWMAPERCPATVCTAELVAGMQPIRDQLIEQVFRRRNVGTEQRVELARAATRLLASSTLDRKRIAEHAAAIKQWLPPKEAGVLQDLLNADAARTAMPRWIFTPGEENNEPPYAQLGPRAERWRQAAMTDLAASAAQWAGTRPPREQRHALMAIRQLLGTAEAPPELTALESRRSWYEGLRLRFAASKWFWAAMATLLGALLWLVLVWLIAHIRERRLLRVSLYNVEYDYLAAGEPDRKPEMR